MTPVFPNSAHVKVPERFVLRSGAWAKVSLKVRYGYFEHPRFGPVLVDAGYGPRVTLGGERSQALKAYAGILRPTLVDAQLPPEFLRKKGISPSDVQAIIVTHFHADHVAALKDFPRATFYADGNAWAQVRCGSAMKNIQHGIFRELMPDDFSSRLVSFERCPTRKLPSRLGLGHDIFGDGSVFAVPFFGHAVGHHCIYFAQSYQPLLYATDTQWLRRAVIEDRVPGFPASRASDNQAKTLASVRRLQEYYHSGGHFILCHDPKHEPYDYSPVSS